MSHQVLIQVLFCLFGFTRGKVLTRTNIEAMSIPNTRLLLQQWIFHGASPRCFPYTTACQLTQSVVRYAAQDMTLELGLTSGIVKLITLLPNADTSRCFKSPLK